MKERFVLRDEVFGGTLFDRKTLRYKYLEHEALHGDISINGIKVESFEHRKADLSSAPPDLPYSPIRIYVETTRVCNLRCKHCFNASGTKDSDEMSTDEMFKALEGIRRDNVFDVRFSGGELTMHPDWYEILQRAKELGFGVSINSNGVYKDPSIIDKLVSLELEQIVLSIDGTKEHHDQIRGRGNFDRTLQSLRQLHERGAVLRTNTVLNRKSVSDMEEVIQTVGPYVDEMNFFHMRSTGRAQRMVRETLSYQELYDFNQKAARIVKKYPHINILFGSQVTRENSIRMNELGLKVGGPDGFTRCNLLANGSLWAGGYAPYIDRGLQFGDIKEEGYTMLQVWRKSPKLNAFRDFSHQLAMRCLSCPELNLYCPGTNVEMELIRLKFPEIGNPYCISDQPLPQLILPSKK
ncbi:radical SAM protein [Candidatus Daviesbacteria bacterium]|nr:radical SAM protein [Candidatus Daviesbacteria bacterium]